MLVRQDSLQSFVAFASNEEYLTGIYRDIEARRFRLVIDGWRGPRSGPVFDSRSKS